MPAAGAPSSSAIKKARYQFFEKGEIPSSIPGSIARSWQRCAALGLPADTASASPLTRYELDIAKERSEYLLKLAEPELDSLGASVSDTHSLILLTDADGLILDRRGHAGFLKKAEQVALQPGVKWDEADKGTNAIGTALAERSLVEVLGAQHYLQPNQVLSCTASPIMTPQGELAGVLDISGDARLPQNHARGLVQLAVNQIEHRWFAEQAVHHVQLRFHANPALIGTPQEGILLCDQDKIISANRIARQLLQIQQHQLGHLKLTDLFLDHIRPAAIAYTIRYLDGHKYYALCTEPQEKPVTTLRPSGNLQSRKPAPAGVYWDAASQAQLAKAIRAVNAEIPVLVLGETGTGKEMFTRALHAASNRNHMPFVAINCAAIPEGLIEAELFGYEEGAFTGAKRKGSLGKLKEANGGILFLDEIGDMPLSLQARLLRVLQDKEVTPLGGGKASPVDFVPVCATHHDLQKEVEAGSFRADLYYRLQHFMVRLTPVRERAELPVLLDTIFQASGAQQRNIRLSPAARAQLLTYAWPGNARELANLLKTLTALADDHTEILVEDLPLHIQQQMPPSQQASASADQSLSAIASQRIQDALQQNNGNISATAKQLGIHRSTLYRMKQKQTETDQ
ncbi:sigma-54-dependent Fis family transcriptional regulator [Leeia oryzae]|uniref:sigma-54-dependent Fis family transcriptional regulator n=1 Tax=Leeia oryzae TaxID=356662 RepID=UPI000363484E|nr:sigma-54-dependent Fis family transcriptional regulator [Leeia oryzae]